MLPRISRLHRAKDIERVLKQGTLLRGEGVTLRFLRRGDDGVSRVAVVVGKRVHTSAVQRHRFQRLLREAMRDVLTLVPLGYDMVVVAHNSFSTAQNILDTRRAIEPIKDKLTKLV